MESDTRRKKRGKQLTEWCIVAFLFALAIFFCRLALSPKKEETPAMVLMGDSIYVKWDEDSVVDILERSEEINVKALPMGGTSLARVDKERWMDLTMDSMSFAALSKAILSGDFSVQRQANIRIAATEYFGTVIDEMAGLDFSEVKVLFVGYGMNDYQNGVPLGRSEACLDEYTFGGALRQTLTDFRRQYPDLRIILLTPTYSWYLVQGETCEERDWGGGILEDYVELETQIAQEYGVELIDLYHGLYRHDAYEDWMAVTVDGVHPNETGKKLIADRIGSYLEEHP